MMTHKWFFLFYNFQLILTLKVCGALLGKQSGRDVEIWNSFELKSCIIESQLVLDEEYFLQRNLLCMCFIFYSSPLDFFSGPPILLSYDY